MDAFMNKTVTQTEDENDGKTVCMNTLLSPFEMDKSTYYDFIANKAVNI